jgi:hypothetical protein
MTYLYKTLIIPCSKKRTGSFSAAMQAVQTEKYLASRVCTMQNIWIPRYFAHWEHYRGPYFRLDGGYDLFAQKHCS